MDIIIEMTAGHDTVVADGVRACANPLFTSRLTGCIDGPGRTTAPFHSVLCSLVLNTDGINSVRISDVACVCLCVFNHFYICFYARICSAPRGCSVAPYAYLKGKVVTAQKHCSAIKKINQK